MLRYKMYLALPLRGGLTCGILSSKRELAFAVLKGGHFLSNEAPVSLLTL
jgi:hypothetical protein